MFVALIENSMSLETVNKILRNVSKQILIHLRKHSSTHLRFMT